MEAEEFANLATCLYITSHVAPLNLSTGPEHALVSGRFQKFALDFTPSRDLRERVIEKLETLIALHGQWESRDTQELEKFFRYFGAKDLANVTATQELEAQRCLLALMPFRTLREVSFLLPHAVCQSLAASFWSSDRISLEGVKAWQQVSTEALQGKSISIQLNAGNAPTMQVDAGSILSSLLPRLNSAERAKIVKSGSMPWTHRVFYAEMLRDLREDRARDVLLSCDAKSLAHWYASLETEGQQLVWGLLPATFQAQIRSVPTEILEDELVQNVITTCARAFHRSQWSEVV